MPSNIAAGTSPPIVINIKSTPICSSALIFYGDHVQRAFLHKDALFFAVVTSDIESRIVFPQKLYVRFAFYNKDRVFIGE